MKLCILFLLILGLVIIPASEIGFARSGPTLLWDTGADITLLEVYLEKRDYQIQPFDLLPAIDAQDPAQLASRLVKMDGLVTTLTQLRRLLNKVPMLKRAVIRLADVPSIVHLFLREPGRVQRSCSPKVADIRCLSRRGPEFLTTHGSSASAAAVITTVLPDLGADCETGTRCKQIDPKVSEQEFADFLAPGDPQKISYPRVVVYVAEILGKGPEYQTDAVVTHSASLPNVGMVSLGSVAAAMTSYGFYPVAADAYGPKSPPVSTVQNLIVLVRFSSELLSGGGDVDTRGLRAQYGGPPGGGGGAGAGERPGFGQTSASLISGLGDLVPSSVRGIMLRHLLDFQYSSEKRVELENDLFEFLRNG